MSVQFDFEDALQARVAWLAIGRSTLRNQGAPGMVNAARRYLAKIDLREFSVMTLHQFATLLEKHTETLMREFPSGARKNWGAARKSLNIFLRDVCYAHCLRAAYRLSIIEPWLEMPLDSYSYLGLSKDIEELGLRKQIDVLEEWPGVKHLEEPVSVSFQTAANSVASHLGTLRVHLDIRYWQQRGL